MAAVLACGEGTLLSHRRAAALWGIRRWAPNRPEVTVPSQRRRPGGARAASSRRSSRRGHRRSLSLDALLDRIVPTQSRHEDRLLRICERFELPMPLRQQRVGAHGRLPVAARAPDRRGRQLDAHVTRHASRGSSGARWSGLPDGDRRPRVVARDHPVRPGQGHARGVAAVLADLRRHHVDPRVAHPALHLHPAVGGLR